MTKVLITGGSGILGINLTKKLLEKKQDVRIYDINPPLKELREKVEYIEGDIRDKQKVEKVVKGMDIVYHTVALVPAHASAADFWETNVVGTEIVARAALTEQIRKFVHISSSSVYDLRASILPTTEESPLKIEMGSGGDYDRSKCQGDLTIQSFMDKGLPATIIRPRTIIGPHRSGVYHIIYDWIRRGKRIYIIGKGNNKFQMISASDMCDACILAAESSKSTGKVFNVGADQYGTLREDLEKLVEHAGTGSRVTSLPIAITRTILIVLYRSGLSPLVPWHYNNMYQEFYLNTTKIKKVLGWQPKQSNQDALFESYDWHAKHYNEIESGVFHTQAPDQKILKWLRKIS